MRNWAAMMATMLMLAGCGQGQSGPPANQAAAEPKVLVRSEGQNQLHRLSEIDRTIGLKRAIYDSGSSCRRITKSGFVTQYHKLDMWTASCADGRDWAIFVGADDSAQVRPCADLPKLGLPACTIAAVDPFAPKKG
ncbi:hypothetical protein HMF7854_00485 [Sphingomonas ginkgonis]|uniref:Uncharacterized protein n=1 Tax=Sphingomonas ginkgonis TaxID=2315330 RepID=A0A429V6A8_9SPHN|nr:hypothetical protein [Sphingomonas ginkgonis]RST29473.1 hypothetical protein HMF7854_00485 [Sphingomonas ginkgonis]